MTINFSDVMAKVWGKGGDAEDVANLFYFMSTAMKSKTFLNEEDVKDWFVKYANICDKFALEVLKQY